MAELETTEFSGVAGRVLRGTLSVNSLVAGLMLGFVMIVSNWILVQSQATAFATPLNHVLFALVAARFVLNGQYGEWRGSIFSSSGGSWVDVLLVAMRFLALTFVWLAPMILIGFRAEIGPQVLNERTIVLSLLYLVATVLTPPAMLIVSVSADSFADLFSGRHWREQLSGRTTDLLSVYAIYTGGMALAFWLASLPVIIAFAMNVRFGMFVGALGLCFLLGMSLDLLGRLCGFFVLGDVGSLEKAASELPSVGPAATLPPRPAPRLPQRTEVTAASAPAESAKLPPLMNAKQHVDQIVEGFGDDYAAAISSLEDLRANYTPNAQVLGALAICRRRNGEVEEGLERAAEAVPLAFQRGHSHLAADVFKEFKAQTAKLGLNREQILMIAGAATAKGDLSTAGEAFSMILAKDPGEARAAEGLLKVARRILEDKDNPTVAIRVYHFLQQHCSDPSLAPSITTGLEEAELRLIKLTPS